MRRGESLDRFVVIDELGRGAMGTVYAAFDTKLERQVAVKLLHTADRGIGSLLAEAQALARINHPNVVTVHDVGEHQGRLFLAMELVRGTTLRAFQRVPGRTWREILELYRQASRGLAAVHAADLVHGDFKPENVMVAEDGRVLVMDFGIARSLRPGDSSDEQRPSSSGSRSIEVSRIRGTPAYMAPEQFSLDAVGPLSDQFAFCVALHEGLWGERPFEGTTLAELSRAVSTGTRRPRPSRSSVPGWLEPIIDRGLSTDPAERFESMQALDDAFDASFRRRMKGFSLLGATGLTAIVTGAVFMAPTESAPCDKANRAFQEEVVRPEKEALQTRVTSFPHRDSKAVWVHIERDVDTFTSEWVAANAAQCMASPGISTGVLAARQACLDQQRETLTTALRVLNEDPEFTLSRASSLPAILPQPSKCLSIGEEDGAVDPHTEELIQAHRAFGRAKSLYALGREAEAEAIVTSALDQIQPLEAHRLSTEMLLWRSSKRRYRGDAAGAFEDVRAAQRAAALTGSPRLAVNGWLTRIDYATVAEPDERGRIEMILEGAEIALLTAGDPPDLRAKFLAAKASWLDDLGRSDEAITTITRALELAEQEHIRGINLASMYNLRGAILGAKGDLDGARIEFARSIDLRQSLAGPHAPGLSTARGNLGAMCMMQSEFACAREMFERMRESLSASGDETSASAAQLEAAFAELAYWEGHPQDSEAHARKSLSIAVAGGFDDRPFAIDARRCLLRVLQDREAWDEGATVAQKLVQTSAKRYRGTNLNTHALLAAAKFHSASGSHETAIDLVREARALRAEQLEATDPQVAAIWSEEATILLEAARLDEAASALDRSEALLASAETSTELDHLRLRFAKLQIRNAQGDEEGAITDAKSLLGDLQRLDDVELLHARRLVTQWLTEHGVQPDPAPISLSE